MKKSETKWVKRTALLSEIEYYVRKAYFKGYVLGLDMQKADATKTNDEVMSILKAVDEYKE